jgi:cysteine desulfurase/selenocysteine lyase
VPWQLVAARTGAVIRVVPLTADRAQIDVDTLSKILKEGRVKVVALAHVSNVLGCVLPAAAVAEMCRSAGARLLLDCCQTLPTAPCDVRALGADWIVASAHKACGPTGIGLLWGSEEVLEAMPPFLGGGEMIDTVTLLESTFAPPPARFEAGTPAIAEAIGFGAAVDYLEGIGGMLAVARAEEELGAQLHEGLARIEGVRVYGPAFSSSTHRAALASFNVEGLHATDVSTLLDHAGVAVRSGHHCAQPLHSVLGCSASARASPYFYNSSGDIEAFLEELRGAIKFFRDAGL